MASDAVLRRPEPGVAFSPAVVPTVTPASPSRLAAAPVALFATVMGLGGLGLAWRKAHQVFGAPPAVGETLLVLAAIAYAVVAGVQVLRAVRHPGALAAEFRHPAMVAFIPTFTVSTAILAGGLAPHAPEAARRVWAFAAGLHALFAFLILRRWFAERREVAEASPAWFIPVVGNLLMPVVGVPLGFVRAGWFLFAVGFVFWLILAPVMTYRLFFADPLPERALPSVFILLAPPAVGGLAVIALGGGAAGPVSHVLFGFGLFIALLTASLTGRVLRTRFAIGWWALTFPTAAFATLSLTYAGLLPSPELRVVAAAALGFATVAVLGVSGMTLAALARGELLPRE